MESAPRSDARPDARSATSRAAPDPAELRRYEELLRAQGFSRIAGADEAGRGALAGPMVAAAVILPDGFDCEGIADSKVLTRIQREACYERIVAGALAFVSCRVTPAKIDERGLHRCNLSLLRRVVRRLPVEPDYVLTDGWPIRRLDVPTLSIKKGDAVTATVAAASIVAKVERDRMMERYHRRYPAFGFDHNRGYGTAEHWETLDRLGPTPIHRLSFKGVGAKQGVLDLTEAGAEDEADDIALQVSESAQAPAAWDDGER